AGNIAVDGGGIRAESGAGALAIQDGQIGDVFNAARTETAGNVATSSGGGISVGNRPFTLVGDASISGNRTELRGGGMHIFDATTTGRERVMDGATVGGSTQAHGNRSRMSGGGLYIDESASFTMRGGTIIHNHADGPRVAGEAQGGGVCVSGGAFIMGNPTGTTSLAGDPVITRNGSEFRGGGIHGAVHARITIYSGEISLNFAAIENGGGMDLRTGAQAVMEGGVIVNNSAREGAGVFLGTAPARLTMNSGAIEYNHSTQGGAGVAMLSGTLTMNNDAAIEDNRAGTRAGGILMFANGTMIMNDDATVRDNRADTTAGGIYVQNAHLTMNDDAMVRDNRAESTGGVHMSAGTFTMNDGNIIANNALGFGGSGGVHIGGGTFTMNDGSIGTTSQPNRGRFGGGVRLASGNTNMNGGSIVGNIATNVPTGTVPICNGGGVFLEPDATFTMNSGNISDNRAINGGGVRAQEGATFSLAGSGAKSITRNIATNDGGGVWVAENAYMTMQPNSSDSLHITYNQATGTTSMGGGIFTDRYYYFDPLPLDGEYTNLILLGVNFDNNSASTIEIPPANASALTNISFADTSDYDHPLNNSDINYENNSDDLPRELLLIKTLELSEDTTLPVPPPSFGFSFDPVQVQVQTSPSVSSRLPADFDDLVTNPQNVEIDPITGSGTPRTYTGSLDLWGLFYGIADAGDFPGGGVFAWNVSEIDGSSNTLPPSLMTYDASRFQIWAWVESDGSLYEIRIFPIVEGEGDSYTLGPKVEYINFNNQYSRQINRILEISKTVTADHNRPYFVNFQQLFDFTLTLSGANVPATLNATIVNTTTQAALPGDRNPVEITGGSASFQLRHNETLQVPSLPPGTSFVVVESAHLEFAPELEVILDDLVVHTDSALANNSLSSGTHTLTTGTGRNAVDFENVHQYTPLTGFTFSDIPLLVAVLPIFALIAYAALRNRKAKEELSL
ncbi:MAG: hypothetical protein FWE48_05310, partial [Coriobacteriia bacterium]|nr:hypothetical protein [Coriobacteriia bacterium]